MKNKKEVIKRLRDKITIEHKLKIALRLQDSNNWENGVYLGDVDKYLPVILRVIKEHFKNESKL